jgi:YihY family inner membrane protein
MKKQGPVWQQILPLCKRGILLFAGNLRRAYERYGEIHGEQCAAAFAYYAFFSLFPLIILLVAVGTFFVKDSQQAAAQVVQQVQQYFPLQSKDKAILASTIDGVIKHGFPAGIFGLLALVWSSLRFFQALVIGVNRAWGFKDHGWWRLPLKNLIMIGILISALLIGLVAPLIFDHIRRLFVLDLSFVVDLFSAILPAGILFYGLAMFYKFAPRRPAKFGQIWLAALLVTLLLKFGQNLFGLYLATFANFNAVYGVFGTIMALLFWIYFSGVVLLMGGCISATSGERSRSREATTNLSQG